jgi:GNAT superfamily N-acetyltransferase
MPVSIQRANTDDLDALLLLMRHMQLDDPWDEPPSDSILKHSVLELLQNPVYGFAYLARVAHSPVAYLILCFDFSLEYRGKGAWVDELFVEATHRGQGIASQLLALAECVSLENGAQTLRLEVSHGNPAIERYRRRGFQDHHRYLMTKWLPNGSKM